MTFEVANLQKHQLNTDTLKLQNNDTMTFKVVIQSDQSLLHYHKNTTVIIRPYHIRWK